MKLLQRSIVMKPFNDLTTAELTQIYNSLPNVRPVHLFRNKATAQERVLKYMSKAEALRRLGGAEAQAGEEAAAPATPAQAVSSQTAEEKPDAPRDESPAPAAEASTTANAVIEVLAAENPHRPNTLAAQRFAMFKSGMTVEEFVAAWAVDGGAIDKKLARRARRQVRKDEAKGYIRVVAA
jgi:hypothetical protein